MAGALVFSGTGSAFAAEGPDAAGTAGDMSPVASAAGVADDDSAASGLGAGQQDATEALAGDTAAGEAVQVGDDSAAAGLAELEVASSASGAEDVAAAKRDTVLGAGEGDEGEGGEGGEGGTEPSGEVDPETPTTPEEPAEPELQKQTAPKLAFRAATTFDRIVVAAAPATKEGVSPKYSLDKKTWQKSTTFKKLKAGTKYTVYVYWPGNSTYEELAAKIYGTATTKYVKVSKIASKTFTTNKTNIAKGRKRHYVKVTFAFAKGVTLKYRYKVGGSWSEWAELPSGKKSVSLKLLGRIMPKKRSVTVEARAYKSGKRVDSAQLAKKNVKIGAYQLDNIGDMIIQSALKYTTPNYYYLMSGYDRYDTYSSKRTTGIDCSGLVSCALRDLGVSLYTKLGYQVSTEIADNSKKVSGSKRGAKALKTAKPGDAIYWGEYGHWIGSGHNAFRHICFYAGKFDGVHYIVDSYPWTSGVAGYDYCKKLCKNPKIKGKKNKFHHGVNFRPITKREIKQIRSIHRFY